MIGRVLGNRYEIVEKIGGGGMALVYKAKCNLLNRYVAIKILRQEFINDDEFISKFRRESQAAASLSHHNIVNIYDVGSEDNIYYIVMEYIKGETLKELIKSKGKLTSKETLEISIQIAEALKHAHNNQIVHRDIKPHNILITNDGRVKVTDFGIARAASSSTVTNTSDVLGSVHYFSPEQARGGYTDAKSDIYSLGIVMYEMITGTVPFKGESPISVALKHIQEDIRPPKELDDSIPDNLDKIIRKAVQKDQSLRYNSSEEILSDMKKVMTNIDSDIIEFKDYEDSPTRVMPVIKDDDINMSDKKYQKKNDSNKNKKGKKTIALLAILTAFLVTTGLTAGYYFVTEYIMVDEVQVPKFVGLTMEEAELKADDLEIKINVVDEKYSDEFEEGIIVSQSKSEGKSIIAGSTVNLTLSKGSKMVKVPDITSQYYTNADIILYDNNLKQGEVTREYSDFPVNVVIRQTPKAGSEVKEGTKIDYVVSKGTDTKYQNIPSLIGINIDDAKRNITNNGFKVGKITYEYNEDVAENIVFWQSYPAGTEVEENTAIDLKVSKGVESEEETEESNTDNNENDKEAVTKRLSFKLPQDKEEVNVKVYKTKDDKKELIYDETHKTSEESVTVPVTAKGKIKISLYFDDEKKAEKEYEF